MTGRRVLKECPSLSGDHIPTSGEVSDFCMVCGLIFHDARTRKARREGVLVNGEPIQRRTHTAGHLKNRPVQRELLAGPYGAICFYCGHALIINFVVNVGQWHATIDHKIPRSRGGTNALDNLVLSCKACNGAKGDLTLDEWAAAGFPKRRDISPETFVPVEAI